MAMELKGCLEDIIYKNEENSYIVGSFLSDENYLYTIVGTMPFINCGDHLKIVGNIVNHPSYGEQIKVEIFEKLMPETEDSLITFLAEGDFEGIGPAKASRIVETFGKDTIRIIEENPSRLSEIKGITLDLAYKLSEKFKEKQTTWELVKYLDKFQISIANAGKVYNELGPSAKEIIENNPYILVDILNRVNFEKIDEIAIRLGYEVESVIRIEAGIKYALDLVVTNGNSCCLYNNLIDFVKRLLGVNLELIEKAIVNLENKKEINIEKRADDEKEYVYLSAYYNTEKSIARKIYLLNKDNIKPIKNIKLEIKETEKRLKIQLSEKQKEAIEEVNKNAITIITGGPGTGKTTIIKSIIEIFKKQEMKPVLCAPTGRAAKRMTELTGMEAKTLHRLLELSGMMEDMDIREEMEVSPIEGNIIIVDEASMIDMFLLNYLLKALYVGAKLVLVGDIDQLPSVGPGSCLEDLIKSEKISVVKLNEIFRQAKMSQIIVNAHKVNEGITFIEDEDKKEKDVEELDDFFYIEENNEKKELDKLLDIITDIKAKNKMFENSQIICPTKKGILGTKELNKILQEKLNPKDDKKKERKFGDTTFRENDRVMQIKNNYAISWRKYDSYGFKSEQGDGVFNGELGRITSINDREKRMTVLFDDGKEADYEFQDLDQIELAYSITVHKSQGSEFDIVIIPISKAAPMLLNRNLIYTAITRARSLLIILGPKNIINHMIDNNTSKKRTTGLRYKIESTFDK